MPPKKMATVSLVTENAEAAPMDSDCISESDIEANVVGVKPSSLLQTEHSSHNDLPSLEIRYFNYFILIYKKYHKYNLSISPHKQIQFTKDANGLLSCVLKLSNQHNSHVTFKV